MILQQSYLGCLAQASYLVGDPDSGVGAVIDPRRDVDLYLEEAERAGVSIRHVFLTHFHADFVSGHLELRARTGADIRMGKAATAEFPIVPMADGDSLDLGNVRLTVWETPGHTPESVCILIHDLERDRERPHAVFTGDTLFIGDVGRPDLMASIGLSADDLAASLYASTRKLLTLPDETLIYPGHGAGSMCGKNLSTETVSTLGDQRRLNYALRPMDRETFVRLVTADQPKAPSYFAHDADFNRRERATLDQSLASMLVPLRTAEFLARREAGAQVLDTREPDAFACGHLPGSLNIGLSGQYASWAGTILDREKPVVLVADPGRERESAVRLGRIGLDRVAGYLDGGPEAAEGILEVSERADAAGLAERMGAASPPWVLDVRGAGERARASIPGAAHIPLDELESRLGEIPRDGREIVVHCAGGYRSMIAASILRRAGVERVADLIGGIQAWQAMGYETVEAEPVG
jgi:hydroxyacylglutathione hydrolase